MARLRRDHFIDLRPFRVSAPFTRLWIGSTLSGLGGQLTIVAVMLHVYDLTQDTFAVSMIAVAGTHSGSSSVAPSGSTPIHEVPVPSSRNGPPERIPVRIPFRAR